MRFRISKSNRWRASWITGAVMLLVGGCRTATPALSRFEFQQPHMGTLFTITLYAPDIARARAASDSAFAKIAGLNDMMTDYDADSELMQLSKKPAGQSVPVSPELFEVLQKGRRLAELSDGAFDVTIGPVVRQWRRARRVGELPSAEQLARAREAVGWRKLILDERNRTVTLLAPNMQLDLGGIAKGFAADQALETLRSHGVRRALVAASGDIAAGDPPPGQRGWRVSIGAPVSDPARTESPRQRVGSETGAPFARTLQLKNMSVSTSGDAEQFVDIGGVRYSHIVDPHTGMGLTNQLQVTIVARHATDTDAFATTVCVLGIERGLRLVESQPGLAALILRKEAGRLETVASRRMNKLPLAE